MPGGPVNYGVALLVLAVGEAVAYVVFTALKRRLGQETEAGLSREAVGKGILERLTSSPAWVHDISSISSLRRAQLGPVARGGKNPAISNTYFLVGQPAFILLAMLYAFVTRRFS